MLGSEMEARVAGEGRGKQGADGRSHVGDRGKGGLQEGEKLVRGGAGPAEGKAELSGRDLDLMVPVVREPRKPRAEVGLERTPA